MSDCDQSSTSDNASVVSAEYGQKLLSLCEPTTDPTVVVAALETNNEENSKLEFSEDEEMLIAKMFNLVGERWSLIAGRIPGRSADEIEKYWQSRPILLKPNDEAKRIGLKGDSSGHRMEEIKGQQ
ncbi:unnamed protein product [Withania somnifera]